ncbi:MAG TPA: hypothetical protein EYQ28_15150, partial [Henriciella sp.]|nr:hypothetical protein [Henriciella sp.]
MDVAGFDFGPLPRGAAAPDKLSVTAQHYIAGLLQHAQDFTLVTNQWVNSYKRLQPGYEAPGFITWAHRN